MKAIFQYTAVCILIVVLWVSGCAPLTIPAQNSLEIGSPTPDIELTTAVPSETPAPTATPEPTLPPPTATPQPSATATAVPTELPIDTYMAYVQNDALVVTHILGGKALETRQIAESKMRGGIFRVGWSPSGEYLTFMMIADAFPHVFVVKPLEDSPPVDVGISSDWGWSLDSKLLAFEHEYELWVFTPASGQSRRLTTHLGVDWLWSRPAFSPAGDALVAAGTDSDGMDRNGNTPYKLYRVPLDGSAANQYPSPDMPAISGEIYGRLPLAVRFSPDGQMLAVNASSHIENCAAEAHYQVGKADGSDLHDLPVASLAGLVSPDQNPYFYGDSLVWTADSQGLWVNGLVRDCFIAATVVGGPQISYVTLDGVEHKVIPGAYGHLSLDRTGSLLGVVNLQGKQPRVQILGLDGHMVIDLGEGDLAALQP